MFAGSEHVFIAGQPKFVTINGEYNSYNQETTTYNVNSNNIIGNSYTETITDNSQTFCGFFAFSSVEILLPVYLAT